MLYVFYGYAKTVGYEPVKEENPYDYHIKYYYAKKHEKSEWVLFYSKTTDVELKEGQKVTINGEVLYITSLSFNIDEGHYECYTDKTVSEKQDPLLMNQKEAAEIADGWKSGFRPLWKKVLSKI